MKAFGTKMSIALVALVAMFSLSTLNCAANTNEKVQKTTETVKQDVNAQNEIAMDDTMPQPTPEAGNDSTEDVVVVPELSNVVATSSMATMDMAIQVNK